MIDISDLSYHIGLRPIFEDASCFIADGTKTGLVGLNGCGKTTLFRLILGQIYPDGGKITVSSGLVPARKFPPLSRKSKILI